MDSILIEPEFTCPVCRTLAATQPIIAEDGFIYHKDCSKDFLQNMAENGKVTFISPMTGEVKGGTFISSKVIESTINLLHQCESTPISTDESDEEVADTMVKAKLGDTHHMAVLGRWHLFGEKQGVPIDVKYGFELVKKAHEQHCIEATAYYGHCLIRGLGTDKNFKDGKDALVDAACEGSGDGRDFAAYTLGFCCKNNMHGFKEDKKKAKKWLNKVLHMPDTNKIWQGYEFKDDEDSSDGQQTQALSDQSSPLPLPNKNDQDTGAKLLFDDNHTAVTMATASTIGNSSYSQPHSYFIGLSDNRKNRCEVCLKSFELKDMFGTRCYACADNELNSKFRYLS
jgi:hypothetical protein